MTPSDELRAYLAPGESIVTGTRGTLHDGTFRSAGAVAVTDRRVLFVADGDHFLDVANDAISSIRSRPIGGVTYRGMGPALLAVLGAGVAVLGFVGVVALEPGLPTFVLALATVGGVAVAERVRRDGANVGSRSLEQARVMIADALDDFEPLRRPASNLREPAAEVWSGRDPDVLVLAIVSAALTALIGLVAATERLLAVPLVLATLVGAALAEYGYRRQREGDTAGVDRSLGREVSIHLVDGGVVRLRVDPDVRFDRDLSAVVRESAPPVATVEPSRP